MVLLFFKAVRLSFSEESLARENFPKRRCRNSLPDVEENFVFYERVGNYEVMFGLARDLSTHA